MMEPKKYIKKVVVMPRTLWKVMEVEYPNHLVRIIYKPGIRTKVMNETIMELYTKFNNSRGKVA